MGVGGDCHPDSRFETSARDRGACGAPAPCLSPPPTASPSNSPSATRPVTLSPAVTAITMGMMLAAEPAEPDVMQRPPRRPGKRLLGKLILWRCFFVSGVIVIFVLGMFGWGMSTGLSLALRRAEAFNCLVFCEIGYSITTRFIKKSSLHKRTFFGNWTVYLSIGITAALQVIQVCMCGGWKQARGRARHPPTGR